ncbi:MAG: class I SAM-dependent DNA methyltransferase, partial [Ottowia sp.]|nr:class I SAM-dependent DNA methyltransferase [Ottowia sp.]
NTPAEQLAKKTLLPEWFRQFRYVNGGLFADLLPAADFDAAMRQTLLDCCDFDWSAISPAIFGAMFQGVMDAKTRRELGAHYTSEENILKVIRPLFLDALWEEFERARVSEKALREFHDKIARLRFLDPACGCGNFLIVAYRELRVLELEIVKMLFSGQLELDIQSLLKVSVAQFAGIEIEDFPCQIARVGMWLMDHLMNLKAAEEFGRYLDRLPLTASANIVHGNALEMDWNDVVPNNELSYIFGNPPFVGYSLQSKEQKAEMLAIYADEQGKPYRNAGKIDYVAAWYFKAAQMMQGTDIRAALVSTNSITQGEQVAGVWQPLFERFGAHIDFTHRTFRWDNEARGKAHVHCVIVGFSAAPNQRPRLIFDGDERREANNINSYLLDAPDVFVESRSKSLCPVPPMVYGNKPTDGGFLFLTPDEYEHLAQVEPEAAKYVKQIYGANEYINNTKRYCLWLVGASPSVLRQSAFIRERVRQVQEFRQQSPKAATRTSAKTPMLFQEVRQPETDYIIVPRVSSELRLYVPIGFMPPEIIVNDAVQIIPNATLYHFGVLTSSTHMAWMRAVCGRLEMRYRYSKDIVYNNFPWPDADEAHRAAIEKTAQAILDARARFPEASLADLYDELAMPPELRRAHQANDRAVLAAYGIKPDTPEPEIVADLMARYRALTGG